MSSDLTSPSSMVTPWTLRVCASSVKACCTNSWSAAELSPSSGGWGRTPRLGCRCTPCLHIGAKTHRLHSAAVSAPHASSRNLRTTPTQI